MQYIKHLLFPFDFKLNCMIIYITAIFISDFLGLLLISDILNGTIFKQKVF